MEKRHDRQPRKDGSHASGGSDVYKFHWDALTGIRGSVIRTYENGSAPQPAIHVKILGPQSLAGLIA